VIEVPPDARRRVFDGLRADGIGVNVHYIPVHTQPYYREHGFGAASYPNAESYYAGAITLPMYAALADDDVDYVIAAVARQVGAVALA
jgi:dTDP-4-amino-4,6-dideoxygalactose transaminase